MADHSRLGRGLASLMGDVGEESTSAAEQRAQAAARADREPQAQSAQPAQAISPTAELDELAASIKERGIIQPIVVRTVARRARQLSRSSPANGAGARRSAPACTRCRSPWSRRPTSSRSNSPSSRTCSAPISIRSKRRPATAR